MSDLYVPNEVANFFTEGPGKTLLVKGNPGAGKTIFAFSLLRKLNRKGIYLSTRVDPESLYSHIGWIKESLPFENIVDATQSERPKMAGGLAIKALKYTDVPDFLKGVYERTEGETHSLVIIDSWDAVVSHTGFHDARERERLEHNLCDFSRKTSTDIIFIAEYVDQKPLDYLVDGVVITINQVRDMRRIRTLELQKLRGGPIRQPLYMYSLHNGIFRAFPTFKGFQADNLKMPPVISDIGRDRLSTGVKDLDAVINGYGRFNLCCGDRTSYDLLQLFFIINALGQEKKLIMTSEQSLLRNTGALFHEELRDRVQVLPVESVDSLQRHIMDLGAQGQLAGAVFFLCLDNLSEHGHVEALISEVIQKGGFVFGFISEGKPVDAELESMAATSLVTQMNFGVPCVYSNVPVTEVYAMSLEASEGFPLLSLTPIQ